MIYAQSHQCSCSMVRFNIKELNKYQFEILTPFEIIIPLSSKKNVDERNIRDYYKLKILDWDLTLEKSVIVFQKNLELKCKKFFV